MYIDRTNKQNQKRQLYSFRIWHCEHFTNATEISFLVDPFGLHLPISIQIAMVICVVCIHQKKTTIAACVPSLKLVVLLLAFREVLPNVDMYAVRNSAL